MYLSRIEMTGFKSFADKTVIEFDQGMTAVVGPNGSGKSNLSEAIRWVLGEQSAKSLRGNRMEDVIFNGTQERKPVNIAKVTLVLNNEDRYLDYDFSEISISRSYNRNGDSDYLINNESVRLKDIVDLLLDSGLGKNSFSIISQGQVEQIFLNKPEERRAIFEEAAGVQKYQYRKNEAARKLERSTDNLNRVKDIIYEIEQQLTPLTKQREAALIYQEKKHQLKELEISLYTKQIKDYHADFKKNNQALTEIEQELQVKEENLNQIEQQIQQFKTRQQTLNQELDQATDAYQSSIQRVEQLKSDEQIKQQEMRFNQSQLDETQSTLADLEQEQVQVKEALALAETQQQTLQQKQHQLKQEIQSRKTLKLQLTASQDTSQEEWQSRLIDGYQRQTQLSNEITHLNKEQALTTQRQTNIQQETEHTAQQLEASRLEYKNQEDQLRQLEEAYNTKYQEIQQLEEQYNEATQQNESRKHALFNAERQLQQLANKYHYLKQAQDNYEGYYGGVRAIMKQAQQMKGIIGPVADVIQVPQNYQVAIDIALGGSAQHIIVEDDTTAKQAIQYLRKHRAGRATFLPKTNIKPRTLNHQLYQTVSTAAGFIDTANQLVEVTQDNQPIIDHLLGITVIVDTIENAQQLARKTGHRVRIVTLAGDLLMPGGAITGGQQKNQQQTLLKRQQELDALELQLADARAHLNDLEAQWSRHSDQYQAYQDQLSHKQQELKTLDNERASQKIEQQNAYHHWQSLEKQAKINQADLQELEQEKKVQQKRLEKVQQELQEADLTIHELKEAMTLAQSSEQEQESALLEVNEHLNDLEKQVAVGEAELKQSHQEVQRQRQALGHVDSQRQQASQKQKTLEETLTSLQSEIQSINEALDTITSSAEYTPERVETLRAERETLNLKISELEEKNNSLSKLVQEKYRQQATYQAQNEKIQAFIDTQLDYLNQEYQLSYEAAVEEAHDLDNIKETQKTVKTLRRQIEQLGPVNLQSIEDYEVLNERYQTLLTQQEDLLTAMAQLEETMAQVDKEVESRFETSFNQINEQFKKTFTHLFMGGSASLELTAPDDLLTTGVDIIAQPPGKKKQNLALLSGGERALTAIALLFALLEVKPVPFVILDEVEAALDDANVYRYGEYIQNFTYDTQFIVITHRKGTMENADVLYGVTMEKSGVSRLASVKLSEAVDVVNED